MAHTPRSAWVWLQRLRALPTACVPAAFALVLPLLLVPHWARGQTWHHYYKGLPIQAMIDDGSAYWFSVADAGYRWNRFDDWEGRQSLLVRYQKATGMEEAFIDTAGFPRNLHIGFAHGPNNTVWLATLDSGLYVYTNGAWRPPAGLPDTLRTSKVTALQGSPDGSVLWVYTDGGKLFSYNGVRWQEHVLDQDIYPILAISKKNTLWGIRPINATPDFHFLSYNGNTTSEHICPLPTPVSSIPTYLQDIAVDTAGTVWGFIMIYNSVVRFNGDTWQVYRLPTSRYNAPYPYNRFVALYADIDGSSYAIMQNSYYILGDTTATEHVVATVTGDTLTGLKFFYRDTNGALWASGDNGIMVQHNSSWVRPPLYNGTLENMRAPGLAQTLNPETEEYSIHTTNAAGKPQQRFNGKQWLPYTPQSTPPPDTIPLRNIRTEKNGTMWGIYANQNTFFLYRNTGAGWEQLLPGIAAFPISVDAHNVRVLVDSIGRVWMVNAGGGGSGQWAAKYGNGKWDYYSHALPGIMPDDITSVEISRTGRLWLTTATKGIINYIGAAAQHYTSRYAYRLALHSFVGNDDTFWCMGTDSVGKTALIGIRNQTLEEYPLPFPIHQLHDIERDAEGRLWLATEHGVVLFNGLNWWEWYTPANSPLQTPWVNDILVDCTNGNIWLATRESGVYRIKGVSGASGITENNAPNPPATDALRTYPNPVTEQVSVHIAAQGGGNLALYSMLGERVLELTPTLTSGAEQLHATFSVAGLPAGSYYLRYTSPAGSVTRQIIVER